MAESTSLPNSQNSVLQAFSDFGNVITGIANSAASAYSTFSDAKLAQKLAKTQQAGSQAPVPINQLNSGLISNNMLVYAGIGIAAIGTAVLLFKSLK